MTQKVKVFWKSLDRRIIVSQRELVLGMAVCALAGIVVGAVLTPKKSISIGSNNGTIPATAPPCPRTQVRTKKKRKTRNKRCVLYSQESNPPPSPSTARL